MNQEIDILKEENINLKRKNEEYKEEIKNSCKSIKTFEKQLLEEKNKNSRNSEKIR